MQISIDIRPSLEALGRAIGNIGVTNFLKDEIQKIAFRVERNAKQLTPVDTGRLRASIHTQPIFAGLGAKISTNTEYAIFVHEGTKFMRGRPFMERGAQFAKEQIEGDLTKRIDAEFVKAFKAL